MKFLKLLNLNKVFLFFFISLCFYLTITRLPFYDEAHAFILSDFSFLELWQITRIEGHPLLWFLILKTINKLDFYPYPMLVLTWIISSILIFLFWIKSPFSNLIKMLILLSFPFIGYFLIVARPYGLTILFLFLLAYLFNNSIKQPLLFSSILFVCLNTTIMGTIGAIGFFVIFIKKIINEKLNKKDLILSFSIILLGLLFLFFQLNNPQIPNKSEEFITLIKNNLFCYFIFPFYNFSSKTILENIFQLISFTLFHYTIFIYFKKNKNALLFLISTFLLLSLLFLNIYQGVYWHYFFYFIFFIISLWLAWSEIKENKTYIILLILFLILTIFPINYLKSNNIQVLADKEKYEQILNRIVSDENLKNSKLYCFEKVSYLASGLLPYLKKHNIFLYDIKGNNRISFNSYIEMHLKNEKEVEKLDAFVSHAQKSNYLLVNNLSTTEIPKTILLGNKNYKIKLKLVDLMQESIFAIYKIEIEEKGEQLR